MKVRIEKIDAGTEEIIIRCRKITPAIKNIQKTFESQDIKLIGKSNGESCILKPEEIYYFESVDDFVFAYLKSEAYQIGNTLSGLDEMLKSRGFFRCSKSFLLNVNHVKKLTSMIGNRIDATLDNGEHIIVSRRYAKEFRAMLSGGRADEKV